MCVCISKITTGIILHSFLFRWVTEMLTNNLSLGRYIIITGSEGKEKITSKFVGGFDKVVNHNYVFITV